MIEETLLELEDTAQDETESMDVPPDRRRVYTDKQDPDIQTIFMKIQQGKIDLQPEFQRNYVWDGTKASRLIESLLLDIPIPVVYLAEEPTNNKQVVVDGQQRLTSIASYIGGKFPDGRGFKLNGLQVLKEFNGKSFKELPEDKQDAIQNQSLRVIVIKKDSDPDVKFEVFERLNVGAVALNNMELRNCVYRGNYNELLADCVENSNLLKCLGQSAPDKRMRDRELVLRFFAMHRATHLKYKGPMKHFLSREMEHHRNLSEHETKEFESLFKECIDMAWTVFGANAFRRYNPGFDDRHTGLWEKNRVNLALWDTVLYTFSFYKKSQIVPIADAIREEMIDLMSSDALFTLYISSTTDKPDRIRYRADEWRKRMDALVTDQGPRNFSRALKDSLFFQNPTCTICGQRIQDSDDAEVDHVEHYWRGGKTIPENARLTHRYCNRARGGKE
jgi:hypothetical protein